ncbi:MAG: DUF3108 domain-containing protein [Gemmatimonadaceae bacterium]
MLVLSVLGGMTPGHAPLPFVPGERMTYRVHVNGVGTIGQATMSVEGPVDVRGTATYLLRSKTTAGIGPIKGSDVTESWLDPVRMAALRFHEHERRFLSTRDVRVEIYPDEQRWVDAHNATGKSLTAAPLDELSFIYFLRSLPSPSTPDTTYQFNRHFDASRNPVTVRVMRGDTVTTGVGVFTTVLMEMRVRDPQRYHGEGVIRVHLSDDRCRIPVRIESDVPGMGSLVLTLESYAHPAPGCVAILVTLGSPAAAAR